MMLFSKKDNEKVLNAIKEGKIDAADISFPNLIDTIVLKMKNLGLLTKLTKAFDDKRRSNSSIPLDILLSLAITAKMKLKTSLTDVAFAVTDSELLSELGWNVWDTDRKIEDGLLEEGALRNVVTKYKAEKFIASYNNYVQNIVMPEVNITPQIHILDCTKIKVNLNNTNYENSEGLSMMMEKLNEDIS